MPVGPFARRRSENDCRPELRDKCMSAYYWMDWLAYTHGVDIQHKLNTGREVKVGKYPVDGFVPASKLREKATVFQFHGCYWHGHLCDETRGIRDAKWRPTRASKYQRTQETTAYLKNEHNVIEMWEYQFRQYYRQNSAMYNFIDGRRPGFFRNHKGKIKEDSILEGVLKGDLFGMVEVDIQVPEQWPSYFQHPTLSPYDYFQEISWEYQLSEQPRNFLMGGGGG